LAVAVGLLILLGCGRRTTYPVKGKIVYEDNEAPIRELEGQSISFDCVELAKGARGVISADGTFTVETPGVGEGALPARYKVSLTQPYAQPGRPPPKGKPVVDKIYEDPQKTTLVAVVEQKANEFTFKLKRKKK
jgi:hypothetical protein